MHNSNQQLSILNDIKKLYQTKKSTYLGSLFMKYFGRLQHTLD